VTSTGSFQKRFKEWLGPDPMAAIAHLVDLTGYSERYLMQVAGMIGKKPWPGSRRFIRMMQALGCNDKPWRQRPPEQLAWAFATREEFEPIKEATCPTE
jgi:hypothetical protein